ncbi:MULTISPECIES: high light inducible protein [unclassified Synechococcus]|uniref:high light inducible protein n=1 Tax=unclassified Synechococcus TaxID=2626047 RepID=UPI0021A39704|nr:MULTISPECIES: high light inducible protein [unclassified Synechococcus]MCT0211906.1 high light inducible protein [Synechococcus sp. CS-1326]MCT0234389.1 high light inducible protein [Synechococcus sp. CS-1327]
MEPDTSKTPSAVDRASIRGASVTTEEGGRLNAFAAEPRMEVVSADRGWGFHERAEKLNGRLAMLGFMALLITESARGGEAFTRGILGIG